MSLIPNFLYSSFNSFISFSVRFKSPSPNPYNSNNAKPPSVEDDGSNDDDQRFNTERYGRNPNPIPPPEDYKPPDGDIVAVGRKKGGKKTLTKRKRSKKMKRRTRKQNK